MIKIGSRGSKLALFQANLVKSLLTAKNPDLEIDIAVIKTTGDRILDRNLSEIGGKGLFIKEIEEALLDGSIDLAVHSLKDMPAYMPNELQISCILPREEPEDALISLNATKIMGLPPDPVIGTSSPRRASQLLNLRPDAKIVPFRGNVPTRLDKIKNNEVDATFLAIAGLKRLNLVENIVHIVPIDQMLPAVSQGAITIQTSKNNEYINNLIKPLNHMETNICTSCERAFQRKFEGSCRTPIAALARINGINLNLECLIASPDGQTIYRTSRSGAVNDHVKMGEDAASELKIKGGDGFFDV